MPADDFLSYATSQHDFYALLEIKTTASETEIRRGYRQAARKYHPDKVGDDAVAKEKFHLIGIGNELLLDAAARAAYDSAREAKVREQRGREKMEKDRRNMAEVLEAGERQGKRVKVDNQFEDAEELLQREIRRIQEANRRKMDEKQKAKQEGLEALEEQVRRDREQEEKEKAEEEKRDGARRVIGGTAVDALERTVKVRWSREGLGISLDRERLPQVFSRFGKVQHASSNRDKDRRQRVGDSREKKMMASGFVVFESIVGAHAAVEDAQKQKGKGDEWDFVESVQWQKEPNLVPHQESSPPLEEVPAPAAAPSTPVSKERLKGFPGISTEDNRPQTNGQGLKKVPSFASFSKAAASTPRASPMTSRQAPGSPSMEELTLMRLKNMQKETERKRLIEQIEREEQVTTDAA